MKQVPTLDDILIWKDFLFEEFRKEMAVRTDMQCRTELKIDDLPKYAMVFVRTECRSVHRFLVSKGNKNDSIGRDKNFRLKKKHKRTTKPDVLSSKHRKRTVNVLCKRWSCSKRRQMIIRDLNETACDPNERVVPAFVNSCSIVRFWFSLVNFSFHCKWRLNSSRSSEWINSYALWCRISD